MIQVPVEAEATTEASWTVIESVDEVVPLDVVVVVVYKNLVVPVVVVVFNIGWRFPDNVILTLFAITDNLNSLMV